jgi:hypothetical protein
VTLAALNPPITTSAYFVASGRIAGYPGLNGQYANVLYGVGAGMFINDNAQLTAFMTKTYLQLGDLNTTIFYDPITAPPAVYTTPQNDTGKQLTMNNVMFPTEYAVSGWFKWTPTTLRSEWHEMFRLTVNSPADLQDLSRLGDRTLAAWTGRTCDCYHFTSYTYTPTSPATGANQ